MQEALLLPDRKRVRAVDVGSIEAWKSREYCCVGCSATVRPKACDPTTKFERIPHFALLPFTEHEESCTVDGLELLIAKSRKGPISAEDKLLNCAPATVAFRDREKTLIDQESGAAGTSAQAENASNRTEDTRWHQPSSTSIEPVCRLHASLPDARLRETMRLNVEGCTGTNYRDVFHQLQSVPQGQTSLRVGGCIFYGELRLKQSPNYSDASRLVLKLNCGRDMGNIGNARFYEVAIEWKNWRSQMRETFWKDLEERRSQSWTRLLDARNAAQPYRPDLILYFLGYQIETNRFQFEVTDYRKLALITEPSGMYRDYPQRGFIEPQSDVSSATTGHSVRVRPCPEELNHSPVKVDPVAVPDQRGDAIRDSTGSAIPVNDEISAAPKVNVIARRSVKQVSDDQVSYATPVFPPLVTRVRRVLQEAPDSSRSSQPASSRKLVAKIRTIVSYIRRLL